jgi:hypothetical protein
MGFTVRMKASPPALPADSDYVPPFPDDPAVIRLSANQMGVAFNFMRAVEIIDRDVDRPSRQKKLKPGRVPAYPFLSNDGFEIAADQARMIADALYSQPVTSLEFVARAFPRFDPNRRDIFDKGVEIVSLWRAFNRVAAANGGYTIL